MDVVIELEADVVVATPIVVHLDLSNSEAVRNEIVAGLDGSNKLVIDLERVEFVDSRGCGAIIACLKHVRGAGGDLKLCGVCPDVRNVLELIRLHRICEILESRDRAVESFASVA